MVPAKMAILHLSRVRDAVGVCSAPAGETESDIMARKAFTPTPIKPGFGRHIRHKHSGRWERKAPKKSRMFHQNAHTRRLFIDGKWARMKLTTRDMRTLLKIAE
jgi:ribosomal protein L28